MVITKKIQDLIQQAPIVPIVTVSSQGEPHLIVVGQVKEVREGDTLVFGIYKMQTTQRNIRETGEMQVVIASREGGPKGYRLTGKAWVEGQQVLFKAESAEALL
ncbi:MAG: pyridoxamine 5'-phosphate oxidase family protein [Thermoanaerobacteraceae bacterium]|nr:pyridoxamine 5'-phosphate oxidase family protein [Thermoanaerobacteraceae bacterium]